MNQNASMFGVALIILTLIVAVILGFMAGPTSPLTWILLAALIAIPFIHRKVAVKGFMEWKDEYSVGIDSIDEQHKKLINLINQLQAALIYATGIEFEREALDAMVDYTKTHFAYEENMLEDNDYPGFEAHKAEHAKMIAKVESVLAEYEKEPETAMQNAVDYLQDWLIVHINGTDKEYCDYIISKGVK
ncbi:MAG: bacteriohemerythrin [Gammaproteobacteria bacterium]|nr:bacteriohemerythrin [Gammaproteobacteria bacterium]